MNNHQREWRSWAAIVFGFVAVTLGGFRNQAWSEDLPPPAAEDLEQRVRILERKLEIADETAAAKATDAAKLTASSQDGFSLKSADGSFVLKFRALIQADGRFFTDDAAGVQTDQFLLRRVRPTFEGTLFKDFDFRITPDLANNSATSLFDAYVDIKTVPAAKLRIGKFKPPVGLERLQSAADLLFVERGFPTSLVPSRDSGVQLLGDFFGGKLSYGASFTNGVADGATGETDGNDGKEGALRIFAHPLKDGASFLQGLGLGIAGTYADSQPTLASYRSPGQLVIFTYNSTAVGDGEHVRVVPQAYWYWQSFGVLGEYAQSKQVIRRSTTRRRISNEAWQVAVSRVFTGEEASFKGVKPGRNFDPKAGHWGAWEFTGRFQRLDMDPDNFTDGFASPEVSIQRATAWAAGLNWYLNKAVKFAVDYEQTEFDRGATASDRPNEKIVFTRWQLAY